MNCFCCGKPLHTNDDTGWHKSCIRKFFGTTDLPVIEINDTALRQLLSESLDNRLTVPGVQKKLSLHVFSKGRKARLTLMDYPAGYILKPQVEEYPAMPESEHLIMSMADMCGIPTVPHALIENGGTYAFITKRIDRLISDNGVSKLAMEDFCQLDLRLTSDKYKGSYERCARIIRRHSARPMLDLSELYSRLVFCFITGNSDMHLKNFSLIETTPGSSEYVLSPAYDLLPVNVILPEDTDECALTLNGKKRNLTKKDFLVFAENCGISGSAANKMLAAFKDKQEMLIGMCRDSLLPMEMKKRLEALIGERCERL